MKRWACNRITLKLYSAANHTMHKHAFYKNNNTSSSSSNKRFDTCRVCFSYDKVFVRRYYSQKPDRHDACTCTYLSYTRVNTVAFVTTFSTQCGRVWNEQTRDKQQPISITKHKNMERETPFLCTQIPAFVADYIGVESVRSAVNG